MAIVSLPQAILDRVHRNMALKLLVFGANERRLDPEADKEIASPLQAGYGTLTLRLRNGPNVT